MKKLDWFRIGVLIFLLGILFLGVIKIFEIDNYWKVKKMSYDGFIIEATRSSVMIYSHDETQWVSIDFNDNSLGTNMKIR